MEYHIDMLLPRAPCAASLREPGPEPWHTSIGNISNSNNSSNSNS